MEKKNIYKGMKDAKCIDKVDTKLDLSKAEEQLGTKPKSKKDKVNKKKYMGDPL